jgi:hypothetical protein
MGLAASMVNGKYPVYDLKGKSIIDIGGGPYSLLLKCINFKGTVVDPCNYPEWTIDRYKAVGIDFIKAKGEDDLKLKADEVWIYNCLQHTIDPQKILANTREYGKLVRIFEWIDHGVSVGHSHDLKEDKLNEWLGGIGQTEQLNESGCHGKSYFGIFKGNSYEET